MSITPDRRLAWCGLFAAVAALLVSTYSFRDISDTDLNSLQTRAIALHGDVDLSRYHLDPRALWVSWHGKRYSIYGAGVSVPAVPIYAALARTGASEKTLQAAASIPFVAAAAVVFFAVTLKLFSQPIAVGSTIAFAFGTTLWPVAAMGFFQNGTTALFQTVGLAGLFSRRPSGPALAGFGFAAATFVRPLAAIALAFGGVFYLTRGFRELSRFVLGAAIPILGIVVQNRWLWGGWLTGGYSHNIGGFRGDVPHALWGLLFGWWRGMFVYSPFLILAVVGLWFARRGTRAFVESRMILCGAISVATILLYARFTTWHGGLNQFGYRYLIDALPFLVLLAAFAVERSERIRPLAALLLCLSVLTTTFGAGPNDFGYDTKFFAPDLVSSSLGQAWLAGVQHPIGSMLRLGGVIAIAWLFWRAYSTLLRPVDPELEAIP
jgi:hypothetical protein